MANSWNVMFLLGLETTEAEREEIMKRIPRSHVTLRSSDTLPGTMVGVRQGAPTSLDAINRVGGQLRKILGRSKLNVLDVRARPVSDDQAIEDRIDDLLRKFDDSQG